MWPSKRRLLNPAHTIITAHMYFMQTATFGLWMFGMFFCVRVRIQCHYARGQIEKKRGGWVNYKDILFNMSSQSRFRRGMVLREIRGWWDNIFLHKKTVGALQEGFPSPLFYSLNDYCRLIFFPLGQVRPRGVSAQLVSPCWGGRMSSIATIW